MSLSPSLKSNRASKILGRISGFCKRKGWIFIFFTFFLSGNSLHAKIDDSWLTKNTVNLETLNISKKQLFTHIKDSILQSPKGLGNFGRISIKLCALKINGEPLIDLNTKEGKKIRFLSNPSCSLLLLEKLLKNEYRFNPYSFSEYEKRRCILTIEQIISPLLEFYSIQFEERLKECSFCDSAAHNRLEKILKLRKKVIKTCKNASGKTTQLIDDLNQLIEQTYQEKNKP